MEGTKGLVVRGCTRPRVAKKAKVPGNLLHELASGRRLSYTSSVEHVVG